MVLAIVLVLGMIAALVLGVREIRLFRRQRDAYKLRRLTLRLSMAGMLFFLFGSIHAGLYVFALKEPDGMIPYWIAYWGCIMLLTGAICCLAIADFRDIGNERSEDARRYWEEMARTIASYQSNKSSKD